MDRTKAPIDSAYESLITILDAYRATSSDSLTESDTRLQLVDRILVEVLGWPHSHIETEHATESGRTDYVLNGGFEKAVVEAKRVTKCFAFQTAGEPRSSYKVSSPILRGENAGEAMAQVEQYARERGIGLAAATTGLQWIVFLASRSDGIPPNDGHAILVRSEEDLRSPDGFRRLYSLLSREVVRSANYKQEFMRLEGRLQDARPNRVHRYLETISGPDRQRKLSEIAKALDPVIDELLINIPPDKRALVLRECFVTTRESEHADTRLQRIVQELTDDIEAIDTRDTQDTKLNAIVADAISESRASTVLLVGQVGSGKSTYLSRFFNDVLQPNLRKRINALTIDLLHAPGDRDGFGSFLRSQTLNQLKESIFETTKPTFEQLEGAFYFSYTQLKDGELKYLYAKDPTQFKAQFGEWLLRLQNEAPEQYLKELLAHAEKSRKKLICVIYDNIDHYSDAHQELAFGHAQWLAGLGRILTILPVRDTTYWRSTREGAFHAAPHSALYLPRPPLDKVLSRRFEYAQEELARLSQKKEKEVLINSLRGFRVKVSKPSELFQMLTELFSVEVYPNEVLRGLSGGDVRDALKIFRRLVTSPWMSLDSLLGAYLSGGNYRLRAKDHTKIDRAAILGQWEHFSQPRNPNILNLLWSPRGIDASPILSLRVLERVYEFRDVEESRAGKGFESVERLCAYFGLCGVPVGAIDKALVELVNARLLEPYDISVLSTNEPISSAESLRYVTITPAGRLHRRWVRTRPSFAILMAEDMAFLDETTFECLLDHEDARVEAIRTQRHADATQSEYDIVRVAREYLISQDQSFIAVPNTPEFSGQRDVTTSLCQWLNQSEEW